MNGGTSSELPAADKGSFALKRDQRRRPPTLELGALQIGQTLRIADASYSQPPRYTKRR